MDVFGHVAASVLLGRAVAPRAELRRATTVAALAGGLLPDIDAVTYLVGPEVFLAIHQLYTHNVLAWLVLPPLIAVALSRGLGYPLRWVLIAAWVGMTGHLIGDVIGLWPVPLLQPFSATKIGFFLLDQDFSLGLDLTLIAGTVLSFWDPIAESAHRIRAVAAGTGVLAAVVVVIT
mgnify:CR=1 FL=1